MYKRLGKCSIQWRLAWVIHHYIIKMKFGRNQDISYYYNPAHAADKPDLNQTYKEKIPSRLIILNGNMK